MFGDKGDNNEDHGDKAYYSNNDLDWMPRIGGRLVQGRKGKGLGCGGNKDSSGFRVGLKVGIKISPGNQSYHLLSS